MRAKPVSKDFGDDLEDCIEETNRSKFINHRSPLFLRNESIQSIVETTEIHDAIVELIKQKENIRLDNIPKPLKKYNRESIRARFQR